VRFVLTSDDWRRKLIDPGLPVSFEGLQADFAGLTVEHEADAVKRWGALCKLHSVVTHSLKAPGFK
jgi:hypothetical protein